MAPRQPDARWHVGREIPIALIFALFLQTGGWIWWAATQSEQLKGIAAMVNELRNAQYTVNDARRDAEAEQNVHTELARRIGALEAQVLYKKEAANGR